MAEIIIRQGTRNQGGQQIRLRYPGAAGARVRIGRAPDEAILARSGDRSLAALIKALANRKQQRFLALCALSLDPLVYLLRSWEFNLDSPLLLGGFLQGSPNCGVLYTLHFAKTRTNKILGETPRCHTEGAARLSAA